MNYGLLSQDFTPDEDVQIFLEHLIPYVVTVSILCLTVHNQQNLHNNYFPTLLYPSIQLGESIRTSLAPKSKIVFCK